MFTTYRNWIFEENLPAWLEVIAEYARYEFSPDELAMLVREVHGHDAESGSWFEYSLAGCASEVVLRMGVDAGTSVVQVEVLCEASVLERARIVTELAQRYLIGRRESA